MKLLLIYILLQEYTETLDSCLCQWTHKGRCHSNRNIRHTKKYKQNIKPYLFSLKIRRHNGILLTTMIDTNVKQYITWSAITSVVSADLNILLLVLFRKSSITFRSTFSNVARDKPEQNSSSFKRSSHKDETTAVYFTIKLGA